MKKKIISKINFDFLNLKIQLMNLIIKIQKKGLIKFIIIKIKVKFHMILKRIF